MGEIKVYPMNGGMDLPWRERKGLRKEKREREGIYGIQMAFSLVSLNGYSYIHEYVLPPVSNVRANRQKNDS